MGVCSYCYTWQRDECFGWSEARGCAGITGPDDPKRLANKAAHDSRKAAEIRREADAIEVEAARRVAALRCEAEGLDREAGRIRQGLAAATAPS